MISRIIVGPLLLAAALASLIGTAPVAQAEGEPIARIAVLSNPYITTLPADKIEDERGSNRGWLARLARSSMEQSVALIKEIEPDAVVILGSLTWSGSDADFGAFAETIKSVHVPVFLTPGLRDTRDGELGVYLKRFADRNVAQSVKNVKGVRLLFAQDLGRLAGLDNAVVRMEAQLGTDGPAKATLLFGGRAHPHGPGELDPSNERFWQFVEEHKVAARIEPCRYGSRVTYPRTLPAFLVGSTAWSLRGAVTVVQVYPDRIRVELVRDVAQPSYGVEVPNPAGTARLEPADAYPHGSPSYAADLATKPDRTFAVVSDPQLSVGRRRKYLVGTTQKAIEDLNRLSPRMVFVTGDLIEDNLPDEWKLFNETFAKLRPDYHIMPGNHDVMFSHTFVEKQYATAAERKPEQAQIVRQAVKDAVAEGFIGPSALYEKHTGRKPHYTVVDRDCAFICMPILTQKIDAEEIEWLRKQLQETKNAKHVFVLGHYPVLPAFGNNVQPDLGGNAFLSLLKEYRVAAFIFGHRHRKGFRMHDGTAHVLCDNMKSIHLFHVFGDRIVIGRKNVGAALYEKLTIPEPRKASRLKPPAPSREAAVRRYIEAEACDGLLRYPYHNEAAPGWYAREANCRAYGAPGRTYCAAIHENAKRRDMTQTLASPIPAGKYRVFLRTVGPRSADRDTIAEVVLGGTPVAFRWPKGGKRFVWLPAVDVALTEPANAVSFAAKQFGGNGHGGLYEPRHRSIWVDTLYATSDLSESEPPDLATERAIRAGVAAAEFGERPTYKADDYGPADQRTPEPDGPVVDDPIRLECFDGRRNLWPNASFELGMNDGWATSARGVKHVFTDRDLDRESPFHGRYSLRLPPGVRSLSRPYYLPTPGEMTLSLYIRGDGGKATVSLLRVEGDYKARPVYDRTVVKARPVLTLAGTPSEQWQRLSATGEVPEGWYYLRLTSSEGLSIDAIQLEAGPQATAFAPRAELEGALRTGQLGNIVYESQDALTAWFHNSSATAKQAQLRYRIVDVRERAVAEGPTDTVQVEAGATVRRELAILPRLRGVFSITYAIEGRKLPEGETVYLRMPKPAGRRTRHELGGNMSFDPVELALHRRLGLKWALTCKTRIVGAAREAVHRKPDEWQWFDDAAARPKALGMDVEPCFWPGRIPEFMTAKNPKRFRPVRGSYRKCVPDLEKWRDYVTKVADHYRPHITQWCIDDEAECSWDPAQYASVVRTTVDAVHENVPGVKVGLSAVPEFTEELLCHVPADKIDFFGASTFDFSYWGARRVKRLRERYGKEWHCYGVGSRTANTMYHTLYTYQPVRRRAARMARRTVNLLLAQGLEIAGHYAAVLRNDGAHIPKNRALCDYDGTALPWGGTFGCLGTLLADAESIGDVPLGNTGLRAYVFRIDRRVAAVTWATCVRRYDHHWRPARRQLAGVSLECAKGSVTVLDMFWNEDPRPRWEAGRLSVDLDEEPVFIMDRTLGEEEFIAMLRNANRPPDPVEISAALASNASAGIDLRLAIRNNTEADLRDLTVDLRNPLGRHPFSTAGEWLLRRPVGTVERLPAGGTTDVVLPTVLTGGMPFEDGQIRVNLKASSGVEAAADHSLWLLPAAAVESPPVIDGQLSEWESRPAAWLAYNWAWALLGRGTSQIHEGGEYFSYPPYRVDARAALWAAWDEQKLYVAMRLEDDQPMLGAPHGERIRLVVCPDGDRRIDVELTPMATGEVEATVAGLLARSNALPNAISLEVAMPWRTLGSRPQPGSTLGFDLFWTDVDREEADLVAGTLRWAGGSQGTGYLLLRDEELSVRSSDSKKPRGYRSRPEVRPGTAQQRR